MSTGTGTGSGKSSGNITHPDGPGSNAEVDFDVWEAALDALEARLASQEAALSHGVGTAAFSAVLLPSTPMTERDRVRAHVALRRVRALEAETRRLLASRPQQHHSPYA